MPINNINTLIDKSVLENITSNEYITKYYNEALANLGQRNIDDKQLQYVHYTVEDLAKEAAEYNNQTYSAPSENFIIVSNNGNNISFNDSNFNNILLITATDNKSILIKTKVNILYELFVEIKKELDPSYANKHELYFPLDYVFEYIADGINVSNIFGSSRDIYISIIPTNITVQDRSLIKTPFIRNDQTYIKTKIYNYVFEYDNLSYNIKFNCEYVLPYINENLWYINDVNTGIQAKSKDAMNLNIVLAYSNPQEENITILSGLNKNLYSKNIEGDIYGKTSEDRIWCTLKDIGGTNDLTFNISVYLPKLDIMSSDIEIDTSSLTSTGTYSNTLTKQILANSTLIVISKVSECLLENNLNKKTQILNELGSNGLITTLWQYNIETQKFNYIYIEKDNDGHNIALDLTTLSNYVNLLNATLGKFKQLPPDNFLFTQLVFDAADSNLKQSTENDKTLNYPAFQNVKASNYGKFYSNNFNFVLKYINKIEKESDVITKISNDNTDKYLHPSGSFSTQVTNSLYSTTSGSIVNNYSDWLPNYNIPIFDLSEILIKDFNVINRQNILVFNPDGRVYYSYIGSTYDINSAEKNVLHIGTSSTNINVGEQTMISSAEKDDFIPQDKVSIDFPTIDLAGQTNIKNDLYVDKNLYHNKPNWTTTKISENKYIRSTSIIPRYKYILPEDGTSIISTSHTLEIDNLENDILDIPTSNLNSEQLYANIILVKKIKNIPYYYKHGDLLYLPNLLKYLELPEGTKVISTTNDIITVIDSSSSKATWLVTTTNGLSKYINLTASNDSQDININLSYRDDEEGYNDSLLSTTNYFVGNTLDLIYYDTGTLIVNERKSQKIQSIWKLPTIITTS